MSNEYSLGGSVKWSTDSSPGITALVGGKTAPDVGYLQELDAVTRVGAHLLVAIHLTRHHSPIQVMFGAPVAVGAGAQL